MKKQSEVAAAPAFDPRKHLISLRGKQYLETKYRIQWFRQEHPKGCISTDIVNPDPVLVKATISSAEGTVLATAHAGAVNEGNAVWSGRTVEKSETAAIGRALAHAGYGTQFASGDDVEPYEPPSSAHASRPADSSGSEPPRRNRRASSNGSDWTNPQTTAFFTLLNKRKLTLNDLKPGASTIGDLHLSYEEAITALGTLIQESA